MEKNQSLESTVIENSFRKRDRIVTHLFFTPMALLCFIGTFTFTCIVIPAVGQLLFCLVAMSITIFVLERCGRRLYPVLKDMDATAQRPVAKILVKYYAIFLIIAVLMMGVGSYLNTHYLDADKAAQNQTHFERIFIINNN